jgi:ligand-binding SRPBCC domain-containing protein
VWFVKQTVIPATVEQVFAFHERPDALQLLLPPWERAEIVRPPTSLAVGTIVVVRSRIGPVWVTIESEHVEYEKGRLFVDEMRRGPFASWRHRHVFLEHPAGCRLRDEIDYAPPLGVLGRLADPIAIRPRLQRIFDYRHDVTCRVVAG